MKILFEDDHIKIMARHLRHAQDTGRTLISFTGIGHALAGINVQKKEFFGSGKEFDNLIFIMDKTRSWGNALDFDQMCDVLSPYQDAGELFSIGNSMGGFLSILCSWYLPISTSVSFVPQYSVNPKYAPWETRWPEYIDNIETHHITHAGDYMKDRTTYYIFSSGFDLDLYQAQNFPIAPNVHHYLFPDVTHDLAVALKEQGDLTPIIQEAFSDNPQIQSYLGFERISPMSARSSF